MFKHIDNLKYKFIINPAKFYFGTLPLVKT